MDVFMWAPWGGASRLLGSAHGMMFLLHLDDSAVANGLQWPESAKWRLARAASATRFAQGAAWWADFPCCVALGEGESEAGRVGKAWVMQIQYRGAGDH